MKKKEKFEKRERLGGACVHDVFKIKYINTLQSTSWCFSDFYFFLFFISLFFFFYSNTSNTTFPTFLIHYLSLSIIDLIIEYKDVVVNLTLVFYSN
jgi:hypothetical protein